MRGCTPRGAEEQRPSRARVRGAVLPRPESSELLPPPGSPFDKAVLLKRAAKTVHRCRVLQRPRFVHAPCPLCGTVVNMNIYPPRHLWQRHAEPPA